MHCGCAVNSVLAIGGVGGLAVGLAGREILENLFTGLIILSSSPFEVGDEVLFSPPSGQVGDSARVHVLDASFCMLSTSKGTGVHQIVPQRHGEGAMTGMHEAMLCEWATC